MPKLPKAKSLTLHAAPQPPPTPPRDQPAPAQPPFIMDYLCILNAFEQNYYNRMKEISRAAAAAGAMVASGGSDAATTPPQRNTMTPLSTASSSSSAATSPNGAAPNGGSSTSAGATAATTSLVLSTSALTLSGSPNAGRADGNSGGRSSKSSAEVTKGNGGSAGRSGKSAGGSSSGGNASIDGGRSGGRGPSEAAGDTLRLHQQEQQQLSELFQIHQQQTAVAAAAAAAVAAQKRYRLMQQPMEQQEHHNNHHQQQQQQQQLHQLSQRHLAQQQQQQQQQEQAALHHHHQQLQLKLQHLQQQQQQQQHHPQHHQQQQFHQYAQQQQQQQSHQLYNASLQHNPNHPQNNSNVSNSLLWQPWRDLQHAAAVHHHLYVQQQQQQQQLQQKLLKKETRLTAKELPTAKWRRDRRMRTTEYHQAGGPPGLNPVSGQPPPSTSPSTSRTHTPQSSPNIPGHLMRPLGESTNRPLAAGPVALLPPPQTTPPLTVRAPPLSPHLFHHHHQLNQQPQLHHGQQQPLPLPPPPPPPHHHHLHHLQHPHHHHLNHQFNHQLSQQPPPQPQYHQVEQLQQSMESPLDMSLASSRLDQKSRASPPPPYREPVPGSSYAAALATRPSVITQAPPKRDVHDLSTGGAVAVAPSSSSAAALTSAMNREADNRSNESISMCDNVIDEHFRRSLGDDYLALMGKRSPAASTNQHTGQPSTPSPQPPTASVPAVSPQQAPPPPHHQLMALQQLHEGSSANRSPPPAPPPATHQAHQPLPLHLQAAPPPPPPAYHSLSIMPKPVASLLSPAALASAQVKSEPISPSPVATTGGCSSPQPIALKKDHEGHDPRELRGDELELEEARSHDLRSSPSLEAVGPPEKPHDPDHMRRQHSQSPLALAIRPPVVECAGSSPPPPLTTPRSPPMATASMSPSPTPPPQDFSTSTTANSAAKGAGFGALPLQRAGERSTPSPQVAAPALPAILRIKTEPGLAAAMANSATSNTPTPPNTPNPSSCNTNVLASVDDHFAKALGDTWKKLQESKELRK